MKFTKSNILVAIAAVMVTGYLTANVMATQIIQIGSLSIFDAGTIIFPITYMLGEVVSELWGFRTARRLILLTFFCQMVFTLFAWIATLVPVPADTIEMQAAYRQIFGFVPRIMAASVCAFLVGETTNAWVMSRLKQHWGGPMWTRTIASSIVGYCLDTTIFVFIAFAGVVSLRQVLTMIGFQVFAKVLMEVCCSTPLAYATVAWIRRHLVEA